MAWQTARNWSPRIITAGSDLQKCRYGLGLQEIIAPLVDGMHMTGSESHMRHNLVHARSLRTETGGPVTK